MTSFLSTVSIGVVRDFLDPASRSLEALQALGLASVTPGLLHDANMATNYLVVLSLLLGFLVFARKGNKTLTEKKMLPMMAVGGCSSCILNSLALFCRRAEFVANIPHSPCVLSPHVSCSEPRCLVMRCKRYADPLDVAPRPSI